MDYSTPVPIPQTQDGATLAKRYRKGEKLTDEEMRQLTRYMARMARVIERFY